jgi:hypothetical protein
VILPGENSEESISEGKVAREIAAPRQAGVPIQVEGACEEKTPIELRCRSGSGVASRCQGSTAHRTHARHADLRLGERSRSGEEAMMKVNGVVVPLLSTQGS